MPDISKVPPLPDLAQVVDKNGRLDPSWRNFFNALRGTVNALVDDANA